MNAEEDATSADYLEEILLQGQQEFLPKLELYIERFVDIINHVNTQEYIQKEAKTYSLHLETQVNKIKDASSVLNMLCQLRIMMEFIKTRFNPLTLVESLLKTGFYTLLNDRKFEFLHEDNLQLEQRVNAFLKFLKQQENVVQEDMTDAFEKYIDDWKKCQHKKQRVNVNIEHELNFMRERWSQAKSVTDDIIDELILDIEKRFAPLEYKLVNAAIGLSIANMSLTGIQSCASQFNIEIDSINNNQRYYNRRNRKNWFNDTKAFLIKYVKGGKTFEEAHCFIHEEALEEDIEHFRNFLNPWIEEFKSKLQINLPKSFRLPKSAILLELKRLHTFVLAVLLNKPDLLRMHSNLLENVIKTATENVIQGRSSILPCISFGQFPLPGGENQRSISLALVLETSSDKSKLENTLKQIRSLFGELLQTSKIDNFLGKDIIALNVKLESNIVLFVAKNMGKLADLSIRSVLVGSLGFDKQSGEHGGDKPFRHAMYPAYNRIYSLGCVDKATGFIPTWFPGFLDRGGEPYYCPNGWRRFSIDVGMTGKEFEKAYGDWPVAYHGTKGHLAMQILVTGLMASGPGGGCHIEGTPDGAVYLSPSIKYCGNPHYAQVWEIKSKYIQMVLQVRVNKWRLFEKKPGTLPGAYPDEPVLDSNFSSNNELEWVIRVPPKSLLTSEDVLVYGLMLCITDEDPCYLPENKWWG